MHERIRKLRRILDLTQEKFAERIGIKRNTVATYESGRNEPVDSVVALICREFHVNEEWLRNGFRPLSGSYISQYHPRNPMFCLGQIGGLRGKSNFIEMQPFWKVKNSHKSSI